MSQIGDAFSENLSFLYILLFALYAIDTVHDTEAVLLYMAAVSSAFAYSVIFIIISIPRFINKILYYGQNCIRYSVKEAV